MKAEVIAIGDELSSGQRLDTNSQWISQKLGELGVKTVRHTTVGDDIAENIDIFKSAAKRVDFAICTGGLGPTLDDLTRQAMAEAFGLELELHDDSLQKILQMFASRSRQMPERNRIQAMFPSGSQAIPNPHGTAPGIDLRAEYEGSHCRFFALPGVPAEMKQMWAETVAPRIEDQMGLNAGSLYYHTIKLFGIGESEVEVRLPDLISRKREPTVGITVSRATISLRIAGRAQDHDEFQQAIRPTMDEIQAALGDLIFGDGDDELQHANLNLLVSNKQSLAVVEIGAASWIANWMSNADSRETGQIVRGTLAFPNRQAAATWAGTDFNDEMLTKVAASAKQQFQTDYALVVGDYPTEVEMAEAKQAFEPYFVVHGPKGAIQRSMRMGGHPDVLGPRIAKTGLDILRRQLAGLPISS